MTARAAADDSAATRLSCSGAISTQRLDQLVAEVKLQIMTSFALIFHGNHIEAGSVVAKCKMRNVQVPGMSC